MSGSARLTTARTMAAIVAIAGLEHGIGEIVQGDVAHPLVFASWSRNPFFAVLGGEPAMSLVPSMVVSGALTIAVSLVFLVVGTVFARRRAAGAGLLGLALVLLLVGGGFGPPIVGAVVGAATLRGRRPLTRTEHAVLGRLWPLCFALCVAAWLALFPGMSVAASLTAVDGPTVVPVVALLAFATLPLSFASATWRDRSRAASV